MSIQALDEMGDWALQRRRKRRASEREKQQGNITMCDREGKVVGRGRVRLNIFRIYCVISPL